MNPSRGGFFSHMQHKGMEFLGGMDNFVRRVGPLAKNAAMTIAPMLARGGQPALAAGVASIAQGMDSYSQLRNSLE